MEDKDYHNLESLVERVDPLLKRLKQSYIESKITGIWAKLCKATFSQYKGLFTFLKDKKFNITPLISSSLSVGILSFFGWEGAYNNIIIWVRNISIITGFQEDAITNTALIFITFITWVVITATLSFLQMAKPYNPYFDIRVYKMLRRDEYDAFLPFLQEENTFTFSGIKSKLNSAYGGNLLDVLSRKEIEIGTLMAKNDLLKTTIDELEKELYRTIDDKNEVINKLKEQVIFLNKLIDKVKTSISRYNNQCFSVHDIDFFCPFTLYELRNDKLVRLADVKTGGNSKAEISLTENQHYASVKVLSHEGDYFYERINSGSSILSFKIPLPNNHIWVINFHIYQSDQQALELFFGDAIIDTITMVELVQAYCRLLYSQGTLNQSTQIAKD
ncbi:hypothetical protein D5F52_26480 (plasmid) [Brevibacillus laterosporus]|uniref:hypothetical protein n=1 Tax=Brevibacillus laterosporus TaxID=1465 RepID=UPI000E6CDE3F|nr:hypothetical protein [Brevibacillus laterosporus]AYB41704.1 hypothetical protein D5F52_26480 [Brevibacillus laterosporus]